MNNFLLIHPKLNLPSGLLWEQSHGVKGKPIGLNSDSYQLDHLGVDAYFFLSFNVTICKMDMKMAIIKKHCSKCLRCVHAMPTT